MLVFLLPVSYVQATLVFATNLGISNQRESLLRSGIQDSDFGKQWVGRVGGWVGEEPCSNNR